MNAEDTPDEIRANVDRVLQTLSLLIREYPTLPADPQDPTHYLIEVATSALCFSWLLLDRRKS
jgi:hypothetical protein